MYLKSSQVYFPNQIRKSGYLRIEGSQIAGFSTEVPANAEVVDYGDHLIIPGFIDQHIHGWATGSFNHDKSVHSLKEMKRTLPLEGVTSFLATSGAEPIEDLLEGIHNASQVVDTQKDDGATLLGVHLEGPFINREYKGMQREECCIDPSLDIMRQFLDAQAHPGIIRLMTIAPELPGARELIELCHQQGIQLNIGHSAATFDCIRDLKEYGLGGVTHMFSGMRGFHHREPGVVGAALFFDDLNCEFAKQTGMTVRPEAVAMAWKMKSKDKIIMTTDCGGIALTRKPKYHYIRKQTFIPDGDGIILKGDDGSVQRIALNDVAGVRKLEVGYIESIRNLIANVHPSVHEIIKVTAENPARYIGVSDRKGSLETGKDADILVVNHNFELQAVYCMGKKVVMEA